jgi:hypothetical protein
MANAHQIHPLVEWDNGYIGICRCCGTYNVAFKNLLFAFKTAEFEAFRQLLADKRGLSPLYTTHGKEVMMPTPMNNFFLVFSHEELDELTEKLAEASPLVEAHSILNNLN